MLLCQFGRAPALGQTCLSLGLVRSPLFTALEGGSGALGIGETARRGIATPADFHRTGMAYCLAGLRLARYHLLRFKRMRTVNP